MGRKLTYYERSQRDREREEEREEKAAAVAERRAHAKRVREREAAALAASREKQEEAKIRNANNEVATYDKFIKGITKLHLSQSITNYKRFNDEFQLVSKFDGSVVKEPTQPKMVKEYIFKPNEFSFETKKFQFGNETQLKESKEYINYSAEQYCTKMNKYKPSVFGWILYFIILFPIAFLHYLVAKKNFFKKSNYNDFISLHESEVSRLESEKETKRSAFMKEQEEKRQNALEKFEKEEKERKIKEQENYDNSEKNYNILLEKYNKDLITYRTELEQKKHTHEQNELLKTKWYSNLLIGNKEAVEEMLELLFPIIFDLDAEYVDSDPSEIEVGFNVLNNSSVDVNISIDKELKYVPEVGYKLTASGKEVSEFNLTQKAKNEYTNACICSLTLAYVKAVFEYCKSIETLRIELTIPSTNKKTGEYEDEVLIYLNANRSTYNKIVYSNIDPVEAITNFDCEYKPIENRKNNIASKLDNENLIWATKEDTGVEINAVIKRAFKKLNYM